MNFHRNVDSKKYIGRRWLSIGALLVCLPALTAAGQASFDQRPRVSGDAERSDAEANAAAEIGGIAETPAEELATIHRNCTGTYLYRYREIDNVTVQTAYQVMETFRAEGACGAAVPNRCRERARDNIIIECGPIHWANRWSGTRPVECSSQNGIHDYGIGDIKAALEASACCGAAVSQVDEAVVELAIKSQGDTGCGYGPPEPTTTYTRVLTSTYGVNCNQVRNSGGCN